MSKDIKDEKVRIISILDMSGSMGSVQSAIINSFNEFIAEQKTFEGDVDISLVLFNTTYTLIYKNTPIREFKNLDSSVYRPNGMTAMNDAIGRTIKEFKDAKNVIMLIQTDGEENSSRIYTREQVKVMIGDKIKDGWDISFLGANIDAESVGSNLGVLASKCIRYNNNAKGLDSIFATMNTASAMYRNDKLNENK